ncbi:hydantoinase B/oxoprolinase family protein [Thermogemmatispora sp.]|uniref:hydantoinase B/oxoprolinase family protein n=1 Tax=Thermogemmatispora sp. TaxID=1968838 RepID=UPI00262025C4|nr:hydantoinase B/oxoprolinase family protein [Thermogemmatispora sp.]
MAQRMAESNRADVDLFTIEIVKDALVAIGDEMFIALQRTSKSTIIYEVLDFASGLTDARGQLITQGNGVTGFLGTLTFAVRSVLEKFGTENLHPGDVVITNDPYGGGGTHLSDVSLVVPIFYGGQLVAFAASKAHWTEVGGKDPGSWTTDSTEVFQEGLQFPCVKLFEEGRPVQSLIDLIAANVRLPDMTLGDMYAQAASLHLGERRFQELCDRYGLAVVQSSIEALLDYGERMTRLELAKLPKGVYEAEDWIDDDGLGHGPFPVRVKVTISDDEFICDFTGTHPQVPGPVNCTLTGLHSGVRTMLKAITSPTIPVNEGCFRPLKIICPSGTIFTAQRPAPVSTYWETMNYVTDLVWKALAPIVPDRLSAGHFLSVCGIVLAGTHPDTNELFLLVEPQAGGWGAGAAKDGESGLMCVGDGETYVIPVEVAETRYGILVERYELDTEPRAGAGRYRGGRGCIREYRAVADNVTLTATFGRHKYVPWGVAGGQNGSRNEVRIRHEDGREVVLGKCARYPLKRGEVARLVTGTGGGWGSPLERPVEAVIEDVRDGYISREQAWQDYGVELDPATLSVVRLSPERLSRSAS